MASSIHAPVGGSAASAADAATFSDPTRNCDFVAIPVSKAPDSWRNVVWLKPIEGDSLCFAWRDRPAPVGEGDHYTTPRYYPVLDVAKVDAAVKRVHHGAFATNLPSVENRQATLQEVHEIYQMIQEEKAGFSDVSDKEDAARRASALMSYLYVRTFFESAKTLSNPYDKDRYPWMDDPLRAQAIMGALHSSFPSPAGKPTFCELMGRGPWDTFDMSTKET